MPAWFRNLSASEMDRIKRDSKRAGRGSQLRSGTMTEGVLRVAGSARIEFEGDQNLPAIPSATPLRSGLMTAAYAAQLEGIPEILVSTAVGRRVTLGGTVLSYDSGPRDISSYGTNVTSGSSFQIRRTLDSLIFTYSFLFGSSGTGSARFLDDLPSGWRPLAAGRTIGAQGGGLGRHDLSLSANAGGIWNFITNDDGSTSQGRPSSGSPVTGTLIIPAQTTLPASLIGSPA